VQDISVIKQQYFYKTTKNNDTINHIRINIQRVYNAILYRYDQQP